MPPSPATLAVLRRDAAQLLTPLRQLSGDVDLLLRYAQAGGHGLRREGARLIYTLLNTHPSMLSLIATLDNDSAAAALSADLSLVASRLRLLIDRAAPDQLYPVALEALSLTIASAAWIGLWLDERGEPAGEALIDGARDLDLRFEAATRDSVEALLPLLKVLATLSVLGLRSLSGGPARTEPRG